MKIKLQSGRQMKYLFILVALLITVGSVVVSGRIMRELAQEERGRIELWAQAMWMLTDDTSETNMDLIFRIIQNNKTIPAILCNEQDSVLSFVNLEVPGDKQELFLQKKIQAFKAKNTPIVADFQDGTFQYVYYDDSITLKRLLIYPYVQLGIVFVFIAIAFLAFVSTKKAEQNSIWVGLSKETAHQLGTPISSLIAWMEYLKLKEVDASYLKEMDKDVKRLEVIAERFSKIGSIPDSQPQDIKHLLLVALEYLEKRISTQVKLTVLLPDTPVYISINEALFAWVIENLTKNAVDAMEGQGEITYQIISKQKRVYLDVTDTGKGLPKSAYKSIFTPGYTTKARGWGLGLSLVKRIVESTPGGRIYVQSSEPGQGTTFRIELPLSQRTKAS